MKILFVASKEDVCSSNMANYLIEHGFKDIDERLYRYDKVDLIVIDESLLHAEWLDELNYDLYIFLSKHRSEQNIPALTSHFTGNYSKASAGGKDYELSYAYPSLQKCYMQRIYELKDELKDYHITIEATHHGPTLSKPSIFVEIGSSIEQWNDKHAISIVCDTLLDTLKNIEHAESISIALGGTHYPSKFNKAIIEQEYAIGHVAPKYALSHIDSSMLKKMLRSIERIDSILLDWKGLGKEKARILELINSLGLDVIRV